jgi:hypothetical protein
MLQMLPSSHSTQLCLMVGMAFFGAMVQWRISSSTPTAAKSAPGLKEEE